MAKNDYLKTLWREKIAGPAIVFTLLICLLSYDEVNAGKYGTNLENDTAEKKVDYLERIYFSGENKQGLNTKILIALQELEGKQPTVALARQVTFLVEIKDKATDAENACDILEMLAAGIYNIDAAEAEREGVKMPSDKAKVKAGDALASLSKLNSSSRNLSNSASELAWSNYLLNGGKSTSFISGASKVSRSASTISNVTGTVGTAAQTAGQAKELMGAFGIGKKKDKRCDAVPVKNIEIGEHVPPVASTVATAAATTTNTVTAANNTAALTTVINIPKVSSTSLRALTDTLRNKAGVQSAEKSYTEALSTITVTHLGSTDALADWLEDKFSKTFRMVDYGNGKINIAPKVGK